MNEITIYIIGIAVTLLVYSVPLSRNFILSIFGIARSVKRLEGEYSFLGIFRHLEILFFFVISIAYLFQVVEIILFMISGDLDYVIYYLVSIPIIPLAVNLMQLIKIRERKNK